MIIQAGDLAVELDTGSNQSGAVLQRYEDRKWRDKPEGKPPVSPVEIEEIPPGKYKLMNERRLS